ncbi:VanZ family protein [Demequina sp. B12]|uniref:VanZ family protein n=1 Tax=Demequina sp. B12 TaxID=2992757 RepID=UPI00237BA10D|nr:VanZ family protein [Demequina sp. B12]MDE0572388.1 VanZ family protein [Demequina sp. B12]
MSQVFLGVLAVAFGLLACALLFVPFLAITQRREGRLTLRTTVLGIATVVYFMALWVYTLLPLPEPEQITCVAEPQLDVWAFTDDLRDAAASGSALTHPAFLQLALNVLLFVPLGVLVRLVLHRGVVVAGLAGLALSLTVEFTQFTGVWGLYPCGYRLFDVDDLLTNTAGAVLGSALAFAVPARLRVPPSRVAFVSAPTPVTRARRLVSMLADFLVVTFLTFVAFTAVLVIVEYIVGIDDFDPDASWVTGVVSATTLIVTGTVTLSTGATVGQHAAQLRYRASRDGSLAHRVVIFACGIGGYQVLTLLPGPWAGVVVPAFVIASVIAVFFTREGRGLPGLAAQADLIDSRTLERTPTS